MTLIPVILAGGTGTRLWPLSREAYPKQLLPLVGSQTLLQATAHRLAQLKDAIAPIVVGNHAHRFAIASQLQEIDCHPTRLLLEPVAKNTAPAITLAALCALKINPKACLFVVPADHLLSYDDVLQKAVSLGQEQALQNKLVTFGIKPTYPATGYGYIRRGEKITEGCYEVAAFVEKPNQITALDFIETGCFDWNSGMFMFRADSYLMELEKYAPELLEHTQKIFDTAMHDADFTRFDSDTFMQCPSISIDYALMEKSENAAVIPLDLSWSDIGSWDALHEASSQDEHGNVLLGDVYAIGVNNSYIHANNRMIAALGLNDHIIVETNDAVLVAHKDYCQHIKPLVEQLKKEGRSEALVHPYEYRPWGKYEIISESPTFKVKFITVSPKKRLSLQKHEHRSEHWVVVKGTAHVTRDEEIIVLKENQSTYIPSGTKHRLENLQENEMLYIIEVQCGEYLGEDDIIRYNDDYGR